ncbi:MAG: Wzz/FepE/Etk N-terminal domain-containing protein [bacterium]|nr:Wzz/FepE/Etk N-terminal domain-containing protein [bacterium]
MEQLHKVLTSRRKFIILFAIGTAVLSGILSFTQPLRYSATIRLLITQKAAFTLDPYTAIRSTELLGENLAQLISTSSFLDRVLQSGYKIDAGYFRISDDRTERQRRKRWTQTIDAAQVRGTGILEITAYHPISDEALKIVAASAFLLSSQGSEYVGRDITVRLVDAPLASRFPVKPNIPLNMAVGGLVGALVGSGWVWAGHRRKRHHG